MNEETAPSGAQARPPEWKRRLLNTAKLRCEFPHACRHCDAISALEEIEKLQNLAYCQDVWRCPRCGYHCHGVDLGPYPLCPNRGCGELTRVTWMEHAEELERRLVVWMEHAEELKGKLR